MRIDLVDLKRWQSETPVAKVAAAMGVSLVAFVLGTPLFFVARRLIDLVNVLRRAECQVGRWSGFIPQVVDEAEAQQHLVLVQITRDGGCIYCDRETTEVVLAHWKCHNNFVRFVNQ
jgi:hypothetical protein